MPISDYEDDTTALENKIYQVLRSSFIDPETGDSTFTTEDASVTDAPDVSWFQALLWSFAAGIAKAQEQIERAGYNRDPMRAVELLGLLEQDYQVAPAYGSTISERQAALALRAIVARGASRPAIEAALTEMLGSDFVAYETIPEGAHEVRTWPAEPGQISVFAPPDAERKIFRILDSVTHRYTPVTVRFEVLADSNPPIPGESFCFDPAPRKLTMEKVFITSVSDNQLTAVFEHPHEAGALACRPHPVWTSNRRVNRIVLTHAAAIDPEKRQRVNEYLARALRATSRWSIVSDAGSFQIGSTTRAKLGATPWNRPPATPDATKVAAGVARGRATVNGAGSYVQAGAAAGAVAGTSTAVAGGSASKLAIGSVSGGATCLAGSNAQSRAAGSIAGTSFNAAFSVRGPYGTVVATSTATATSSATAASRGTVSGLGNCAGVGAAQVRAAGSIAATGTVHGVKG
ncbi:MAG TPA: hypothetical protein VG734_25870 [Lacunisphaera sp.]|nr:hypothetical protein [Lacunisphaera sp.]